jgi:iron-sulfur cluster repair protein YtfE (RIC family)
MVEATNTWQQDSQGLYSEHRELIERLAELDRALEGLICYSEVYADLAGVQRARETAQWLTGRLAEHFLREEQGVFAALRQLGPEDDAFAREMQRQHREIDLQMESFRKAAESFVEAVDLQQSIGELQVAGKSLGAFMAAHMGAEERKYAGLR